MAYLAVSRSYKQSVEVESLSTVLGLPSDKLRTGWNLFSLFSSRFFSEFTSTHTAFHLACAISAQKNIITPKITFVVVSVSAIISGMSRI